MSDEEMREEEKSFSIYLHFVMNDKKEKKKTPLSLSPCKSSCLSFPVAKTPTSLFDRTRDLRVGLEFRE